MMMRLQPQYAVFSALLFDLLAFTVYLPIQPALLQHYATAGHDSLYQQIQSILQLFHNYSGRVNDPRWDSVMFGGLLGSMFSFIQFAVSPFYGRLSDIVGRKPVLLCSIASSFLAYAVWFQAETFTQFVGSRVLIALSRGIVGVSIAAMADIFSEQSRSKGMMLIGIAFSLGFTFGPIVGVMITRQFENVFATAAALSCLLNLIAFLILAFCYDESNVTRKAAAASTENTATSLLETLKVQQIFNINRNVRYLALTYFTFLLIYSGLEFTLSFLTFHKFSYDANDQGRMYFFVGMVMLCIQGGIQRRLNKPLDFAMSGVIAAVPAFFFIATAYSHFWFYVGLFLYSFSSAVVVPSLTTLVSLEAGSDQQGYVSGLLRSLGALARAIGPLLASIMYWRMGSFVTYVLGGTLMLCSLYFLSNFTRSRKRSSSKSKSK